MISPDARSMVLESVAAGCSLAVAAKGAGVTLDAVHAEMTADPSFALAVSRAADEGAAAVVAASRPAKAIAEPQRAHASTDPGQSDRRGQIEREAAELAPGPFGRYLWIDAKCIAAGMPATSPWWRFSIGALYASGKPWGFFGPGRGGGKSTTLERFTAERALLTPRRIPPGQTWTWPFISIGPDDANRRIDGLAAVFRAAGLAIIGEESADGERQKEGVKVTRAPRGSLSLVDLDGNPIQLASIAGTIGNVSGPSTIGLTIDEAAKLHDKTTNANPLAEIVASGAQTSRGRVGWQAIVSSSAWERRGTFWQLIEAGDNESNFVARIGAPFLEDALRGFEAVAQWEERGAPGRPPDPTAAATIREHARSLTAESPMVPTWVANPTLGHPNALPWDGAALASRKLVEVLPASALGGIPRVLFWLRENGSVPMDVGAGRGGSRWTAEDWAAHREAMREVNPRAEGTEWTLNASGLRVPATRERYRGL